jgi:hypothetical protein
MTSRPEMIGLMALCWMAEGFSKSSVRNEDKPDERDRRHGARRTVGVNPSNQILLQIHRLD